MLFIYFFFKSTLSSVEKISKLMHRLSTCTFSISCHTSHIRSDSVSVQTLDSVWCFRMMDDDMLSYLSQPGGSGPRSVGLQVAASISCLVNQTEQLHTLWEPTQERKSVSEWHYKNDGLIRPMLSLFFGGDYFWKHHEISFSWMLFEEKSQDED